MIRTGNLRLWVGVGLAVGVGLEAKQTIPLLFFGLVVGFVFNGQFGAAQDAMARGGCASRARRRCPQSGMASKPPLPDHGDERCSP